MADLLGRAAAAHGPTAALVHKQDGEWRETSYAQLAEQARAVGLGLVDLGIEPDERVAILAYTRPEWTLANLGITSAGAASVAMYQTSSAVECRHVLEHSEAVAVIVEDAEQLAKIRRVREHLPALRQVVVMAPVGPLEDALA